jgi:hypothetical protein
MKNRLASRRWLARVLRPQPNPTFGAQGAQEMFGSGNTWETNSSGKQSDGCCGRKVLCAFSITRSVLTASRMGTAGLADDL